MKNFDSYYDPPEGPETPICEECGQDMVKVRVWYTLPPDYKCENQFCPAKFHGTAKEMAQALVDALDTVSELELKVRLLNNRLNT